MARVDKLKLAIFASGEGTTLQAVLDACALGSLNAEVTIVISNNRDAGALRRARAASVNWCHLSAATHPTAESLDCAILSSLLQSASNLVVLAGYMKKIGPLTLAKFKDKILNTHPALLPKHGGQGMYGRHVYEAVLGSGEPETGVSIHLVDGEYDHGIVIAQTIVPVMTGDSVDTLSDRVQAIEGSFLVSTLASIASSGVGPNRAVNADAPVQPFYLASGGGGAPVTLVR